MNPSLKKQLLKTLIQMLADLENKKEIESFMVDFFDEQEIEKYIKRIATSYWLKKGRDEENIKRNLMATSEEITEARKSLSKAGIKLAIKKMEAEEWANVWAEKIKGIAKK